MTQIIRIDSCQEIYISNVKLNINGWSNNKLNNRFNKNKYKYNP